MEHVAEAFFPSRFGKFRVHAFLGKDGKEHLAVVMEKKGEMPVVRLHSRCLTGDALCSLRCDCRQQLEAALEYIAKEGGIFIYLDQEGRGIGLTNKIKAYALQDEGMDTVEANVHLGFEEDERSYDAAAKILEHFKITEIALLTNNPKKMEGLEKNGIKIVERIPLVIEPTEYNGSYLKTKKEKMHHQL